ncbi:hypothetical protein GWI33_018701 [Rhynchophorus ferrugineus]|uniref:Uncharacterized protein n=1 Tax=Rhynchophorus ferrugineus TaxID=354439 RepID=A0A834M289_RHYFE|nr:hypothetical protein GWI33_018701 [Rhynchophorus ferrugineus]
MATLGLSKVFILDKYFTELQKFWETEKKLQGTGRVAGAAGQQSKGDAVDIVWGVGFYTLHGADELRYTKADAERGEKLTSRSRFSGFSGFSGKFGIGAYFFRPFINPRRSMISEFY